MLAYRLRSLRKQHNWSQEVTAAKLHMPRGTYSHYETNDRQPDYATLTNIANLYNVSIDYLIGRTDDPSSSNPRKEKSIDEKIYELIEELELNDQLKYKADPIDAQTKEFLLKTLTNTLEMAELMNKS